MVEKGRKEREEIGQVATGRDSYQRIGQGRKGEGVGRRKQRREKGKKREMKEKEKYISRNSRIF